MFPRSSTGSSTSSSFSSRSLDHFQTIEVPVFSMTPSNPSAAPHTYIPRSSVYALGHPLERVARRRLSYSSEKSSRSTSSVASTSSISSNVEAEESDFIDWTSTSMAINRCSHHLDLLREDTFASTSSTSSRRSLTGSIKCFAYRASHIVKRK